MSKKLATVMLLTAAGCTGASPQDAPDAGASAASKSGASSVFARVTRSFTLDREASATAFDRVAERIVPRFAGKANAAVSLPARADGAFEVRSGPFAMRVRLEGARATIAQIEGQTVAYEGVFPGTTLLQRPNPTGTEEYLYVEGEIPNETRYSVDLEGIRSLRLVDGVLELIDATGQPRLRTYAPEIRDADGKLVQGTLRVEGCAVDTSPALPWIRPLVAAGASHCTIVTSFDATGLRKPLLVDPPWTTTTRVIRPRFDHRASTVTVGTTVCILVTGGAYRALAADPLTFRDSGEVYCPLPPNSDPTLPQPGWATTGGIPGPPRMRHVQVPLGGTKVLIAGGARDALSPPTALSTAYIYDSSIVSPAVPYTVTTAMPDAVYDAAADEGDGKVFVVGGATSLTTTATAKTRAFDIATSTWSAPPDMATPRAGHVTFITNTNRVWAAGGWNGTTTHDTVEYLDFKATSPAWKTMTTKLAGPRRNFAYAQLDTNILLAGGGPTTVDMLSATTVSPTLTNTTATIGGADRFYLVGAGIAGDGTNPNWGVFVGGMRPATSTIGDSTGEGRMFALTAPTTSFDVSTNPARRNATATKIGKRIFVVGGFRTTSAGEIRYPAEEEIFDLSSKGAACTTAGECASGFCVDGFCCGTACGDQCAACDLPGSEGTCKATAGAPHGGRTPCDPPRAGTCGNQCDGITTATCKAPTTAVVCEAAACGANLLSALSAATCNGTGSCGEPVRATCDRYLCNPDATPPVCRTKCTDSAHCKTGYKCDLTTTAATYQQCIPTGDRGSPCTATTDCQAKLTCTDGVCCGSDVCAGSRKCNVPGYEGTCYLPFGTACTAATGGCPGGVDGHCVDGVCCDTACNGTCEQCNAAGSVGACTAVAVGQQPPSPRTACSGSGACQATCNGIDRTKCGPLPGADGAKISCATASCVASVQTGVSYCNAGICETPDTSPCVRYACGATACKTSCLVNTDCAPNYFCSSGACESTGANGNVCATIDECNSKNCVDGVCCTTATCDSGLSCAATKNGTCARPLGAACTGATECGSGFCADGYCCNAACDGQCEACNVSGSLGTCGPVRGAPVGTTRAACTGTGGCKAECNGTDRLKCGALPGTTTVCSTASCSGKTFTPTAYCDGAGTCAAPSTETCAPFLCGATACRATCATKADCDAGYACTNSVCVTEGDPGTYCTDATQCKSGFCVDAGGAKKVCCEVAVCEGAALCGDATTPTPGKCVSTGGATCTTAADCSTGYCVDGVCCNTLCSGQCQSCKETGVEGKCVEVTGAPRGARPACFDGGGDVCKVLTCDGVDGVKCAATKNGLETTCAPAACTEGVSTPASRCDGKGTCTKPTTVACSGYACAADGACKTTCASPADCLGGYGCSSGKCAPKTADCSADRTQSIRTDGASRACTPFLCDPSSGECLAACVASTDCVAGAACDGGKCVPAAAPIEDEGGCSTSGRGSKGSYAGLAAIALVALATRRRRAA